MKMQELIFISPFLIITMKTNINSLVAADSNCTYIDICTCIFIYIDIIVIFLYLCLVLTQRAEGKADKCLHGRRHLDDAASARMEGFRV